MSSDAEFTVDDLMAQIQGLQLPRHIAVIMDGNGRWAKQRGLPRVFGHVAGRESTKHCIEACNDIGIEALSLYAFSAENWRRPADEVEALMELIGAAMYDETEGLVEANVRVRGSGRMSELSDQLQEIFKRAEDMTAACTGMVLTICVNYGGRTEILDAVRSVARRVKAGELEPDAIDEADIVAGLYQPDLPEVDLLVRPGGEMRVSNFLLWQIAYAELIVMPVLWPDFREQHLGEAIMEYNHRQRRFGGIAEGGDDL
jgi:undecaprenyl diphosphate synthase